MTHVSGIPVTSATRTILDLASVTEEEAVEIALDCALRRGLTSISYLRRRHEERLARGRRGSRTIAKLLVHRTATDKAPESALETIFFRLLREARVPLPERGYQVGPYRLDFAYPHLRLGIELDGYAFHSGKQAWENDLARQNYLVRVGWTLIRFTWHDVKARGGDVVAEVRTHVCPTLLR